MRVGHIITSVLLLQALLHYCAYYYKVVHTGLYAHHVILSWIDFGNHSFPYRSEFIVVKLTIPVVLCNTHAFRKCKPIKWLLHVFRCKLIVKRICINERHKSIFLRSFVIFLLPFSEKAWMKISARGYYRVVSRSTWCSARKNVPCQYVICKQRGPDRTAHQRGLIRAFSVRWYMLQ